LFTNELLFKELLKSEISAVGTLNKNRKGIPDSFREVHDQPVGSYDILYEDGTPMSLHRWVSKSRAHGRIFIYIWR
jgi:hypothetical protein